MLLSLRERIDNMQNKHINEFLDYYIELSNPQYAVLLKGKWGSGKTYFINEYKKELDKKQKYIYVSLYGVTSYDEIETKFLETIHPILYNKKTIFAGKIAKQVLKGSLKIDFNSNKKDYLNVDVKVPDFKPEDLLNTQGYILIFDDLERCSINIINLLGYINFFVEHQSYKVILIANEEELEKTEKYTQIKEKLIGKTFEFKTNPTLAYESFLTELKNTNNIKENILEKQKSNILKLFEKSQSNNLRALRQTLLDFERFYDEVLVNHQSKKELIEDILYWFFLFSFEIRQGKSEILELDEFKREHYSSENKETKYNYYLNKYKFDDNFEVIISFDLWKKILLDSNIDKNKIDLELRESKYYLEENIFSWELLYEYHNLEDDKFEELFKDVYTKFSENKYKELNLFLLISSILLYIQENSIFEIKLDELFNLIKSKIKKLFDEESIVLEDIYSIKYSRRIYKGYSYLGSKSFKELFIFITEKFLEDIEIEFMKKESKFIIEYIKEKNENKLSMMLEKNSNLNRINYWNKPILVYINIDDFFDEISISNYFVMSAFGSILDDRYTYKECIDKLLDEKLFLEDLLEKINNYLIRNRYKFSSYNLEKCIKGSISKALDIINNHK